MAMLADLVELVIGVDTHKDTHTAAVVTAVSGAVVTQVTVPATPVGYQQLLQLAARQPGQRVWAVEGTGGYGAGLTRFLAAHQEQVVELDRPTRAANRIRSPASIPGIIAGCGNWLLPTAGTSTIRPLVNGVRSFMKSPIGRPPIPNAFSSRS